MPPNAHPTKLLFLDIDGVLHPDGYPSFSRLEYFQSVLADMPGVAIVISSSWRMDHSFEKLLEFFPPGMRGLIIGATPLLENCFDPGGRQREIEAFLAQMKAGEDGLLWVALDDSARFFDADCPQLVLVDGEAGFGEADAQRLRQWYGAGAA